jgi:Fe-S cluster assembly protein SufD
MDEQAVFYLRSRGLPEAEARALIVRAFLVAALPDWLPDAARHEAERRIDLWLERRS